MKTVNVILAFHAQEPLWDLPARVLQTIGDEDVRREAVGNDNWIRKRAEADRDIYADLLALGARLNAPLCLEATNELLMQLRRYMPDTFARLGDAYRSGAVYPIYGNAFHTHIAMLTDDELADELRLNREFLRDVASAPAPRHPGAFPMEGSIDAHKLAGFESAGMEYVIFPNLSERKMRYRFEGLPEGADPTYGAFTIGHGLIALPRHFAISQEIWRPITKMMPERLAPQGYILGKYFVLDEEYRAGHSVDFPISRKQGVAEYAEVVRTALRDCPDGGLLLYIQDLELMDFGDVALDILGEAWAAMRAEAIADIRFVTPDAYIDDIRARGVPLPHMRFNQASWAPEIRLVLRSDGHYPPLHAGEFRGIDNDTEVFRRWPFIFWEPGRFIADVFKSLLRSFGHDSQSRSPDGSSTSAPMTSPPSTTPSASPCTCGSCSAPAISAGSRTKTVTSGRTCTASASARSSAVTSPTPPSPTQSPHGFSRFRSAPSAASTACSRSSSIRASPTFAAASPTSASAPVMTQRAPMRSSISRTPKRAADVRRPSCVSSSPRTSSSSPPARSMGAPSRACSPSSRSTARRRISPSTRSSERGCPSPIRRRWCRRCTPTCTSFTPALPCHPARAALARGAGAARRSRARLIRIRIRATPRS